MSATVHDEAGTTTARADVLGWGTVRAGLGVSFFGTLLTILCPILLAVTVWTLKGQEKPTVLQAVALGTCVLGWLGGAMLFIAGACMGAAAPANSGVRGWSIGVCFLGPVCVVMFVLLGLIGYVELLRFGEKRAREHAEGKAALQPDVLEKLDLPAPLDALFSPQEIKAIGLAFEGVCLLTLLCHLLGMRAAAARFNRGGLSIAVACFVICSVFWVAGVNGMGMRDEERTPEKLQLLGMLVLAGLAVLQVWYLALAAMIRRAISTGLQHG